MILQVKSLITWFTWLSGTLVTWQCRRRQSYRGGRGTRWGKTSSEWSRFEGEKGIGLQKPRKKLHQKKRGWIFLFSIYRGFFPIHPEFFGCFWWWFWWHMCRQKIQPWWLFSKGWPGWSLGSKQPENLGIHSGKHSWLENGPGWSRCISDWKWGYSSNRNVSLLEGSEIKATVCQIGSKRMPQNVSYGIQEGLFGVIPVIPRKQFFFYPWETPVSSAI